MSRRIVGPFNRVEGDVEVQLDIVDGVVREAWVVSLLYRGFEQILRGKAPADALVYTPRICGICSVSQSIAAATALADCQGVKMPPNGELATNLILANENITDHLTHFYLFFMPDFAREIYAADPWYPQIAKRFRAISGTASQQVLPVRAQFLHLMGLLAGKWPHSLAIQPGGTTRAIGVKERMQMAGILFSFRQFLESTLFGDQLENILAINSSTALQNWAAQFPWQHSDFCRFLHVADVLSLDALGQSDNSFMSNGAYLIEGKPLLASGVWRGGDLSSLNPAAIREDISHSWMAQHNQALHPYEGITVPDADAPDGYSWGKAPRLESRVVEVGALARQVVAGDPLAQDLVRQSGSNVRNRVIGRLLEIARVVVAMESWVGGLQQGKPYCNQAPEVSEASGCGLVEAARGSLGHWIQIEKGRIQNYQIIAPTTWNFSPRDAQNVPGALEQALVGAPVRAGEKDPVSVQHIVRSFDPCMVCTVH
ncbi:MAG: nickel-dependent hydrogenase large subunit [Gammaproteobacteria bacterium]|nr:nickel-dependent hydrogenase large subunit [Gammaproteobacteria bacterium]